MYCHHCSRPISSSEYADVADAGARVPLCSGCTDILVWGGLCSACEQPIYASGKAAPRCTAD